MRTARAGAKDRLCGALLRPLLLVLLTATAAPAPRLAHAQAAGARPKLSETQKQEVRDRYERATRFYYLRKYPEAVGEYEAIYLLSADPVMLYNIAQCHRQANEPEKAAQFYRNYLRNDPAAANRADVEKKVAEMDKLVEDGRRAAVIPTPPPPTTVPPSVPGAAPGTIPNVGSPPPAQDVPVSPEATNAPPSWSPPPTGVQPQVSPTFDVTQTAAPAKAPSRVLRWSLLVGGGVFLTTSIVAGAVAAAKAKEIEKAAQGTNLAFDANLQETEKAGRAANGLAVGTGLIGLAALGTGLYLWKGESDDQAPHARSFVVPVAGPGYAGALAKVGF